MNRKMRSVVLFAATMLVAWGCSRADSGPQTVSLSVSEHGFTPLHVVARVGAPLTLLVTRESEAACAKEIMIPGVGIRRLLPFKEPVRITFTPERRGRLKYTCCDEMAGGSIDVR